MNTTPWPSIPRAVATVILGVVLALAAAGCTLLRPRANETRLVTINAVPCSPLAEAVVLDRGPSALVWPQFQAMVTGTARCGEHLIVIDAGSGRQLGSFFAPPDPTMRVPAPPPPLAPGATSYQVAEHKKAVAAYHALISNDLARLRGRAQQQLTAWADRIIAKVGDRNGVGLDPSGGTLARAMDSAAADLTSLRQSGVPVGNRVALAVLGLQGLSDSAPRLSVGLAGACVAVTGFPLSPDLMRAWRSELRWQGARSVVLLTPAVIGQLPAVLTGCLAGR
jgi:hypothetical protein